MKISIYMSLLLFYKTRIDLFTVIFLGLFLDLILDKSENNLVWIKIKKYKYLYSGEIYMLVLFYFFSSFIIFNKHYE